VNLKMIKTVWVDAYFVKKGRWEEYEEPTGEVKKGLFGTKAITVKKRRWVELNEYSENRINGKRLSDDTQKILSELESSGYEVLNITPVISGNYSWKEYSSSSRASGVADTCASWGYSVTEGIMITAKKS
jgi:hypothetical protein